jgi:hypothetical protein
MGKYAGKQKFTLSYLARMIFRLHAGLLGLTRVLYRTGNETFSKLAAM